jgi:hypothetical protein
MAAPGPAAATARDYHSRRMPTGEPPPRVAPNTWIVAGLYLALTMAMTYPLSMRPASTIIWRNADTDLFMWTLAWNTHAIVHQPFHIFDANVYFPYSHTLAYSENLLGSTIFAAPVLWATGNPVLALNVVALASVFLCGLGGYLLGRRLGLHWLSAFVCGLVFAFAPSRFYRITQLHLTTVQWIPFALAWLHAYLDGGRRRDVRIAIAFLSLQALTSGHGAVFLVVAAGGLVLFRLALGEPLDPLRRLRDVGLTGVVLLAPTLLIAIPYRAVQVEMGLRRAQAEAPAMVSFLAAPTHVQAYLLSLFPDAHVLERASALLFPGFLTLLLAGAAFLPGAVQPPARRDHIFYGLLTAAALLLATGILWPYVYWLPGLNFTRAPSRFMILATLTLAVLAGMGLERLRARVAPARRTALTIGAIVLALVEFNGVPFEVVPHEVVLPAADRWLAGQPKPFVVAEAPVQMLDRYQTAYMLHSRAHWQRTVHGYSGIRPPLHEQLFRQMQRFPDVESIDALAVLGVTYVVVHIDQYYEPGEWPEVEKRLADFTSRLTLEYQDRAARVYSIHRAP